MASEMLDEKAIFNVARRIGSPDARAEYLRQACGTDPGLHERVQVLLRAYEEQASFLESSPPVGGTATVDQPASESPGTVIGPYKLIEEIGEGGMGTVWMAQQTEPVKRLVALKLIKAGMDSKQVVARFEAERQALALMDHLNIAKVLDGGTTPSGRPYFVMDLVKGVPITKYCDEHHLTPRQRLELFVPVCQAVQHAHHKGIIHRDLKPSNVLVALYDGKPVPKVIDFGVAKAAGQTLTDKTLVTGFGNIVGTLEYMSPEQAEVNQLDIDTRSDVYSLGVLLYELLTGSTPFMRKEVEKAGMLEMLRVIREQEPSKPSTKLSSSEALPMLSVNRGTEPAKLTKLVRGELDWIVMKALEKDRSRRYETANGFALDVQRYLADEAVQACPPSAGYRLRKFVRRNKQSLASASLLALAVLAVAGTLGWALRDREATAQQVARDRADRDSAIQAEVLTALKEAERWQEQEKWPEALSAVKRAEGLLAGAGSDELRERVQLLRRDVEMVLRLEEIRAQRGGDFDDQAASQAYAQAFADFGIDVEVLSPTEAAARIRNRSAIAVELAGGLDYWAMVRRNQKDDPVRFNRLLEVARLADPDTWRIELRQLMGREDLNALRKLAGTPDIDMLPVQSLQLLANALIFGGDRPACIAWLRKAHRQHPGDSLISFDLAFQLHNSPAADWVDVLCLAEAALAARPQSAAMHQFVGHALNRLGRHDEAIACFRKAIELKPDLASAHAYLGSSLAAQGRLEQAIAYCRKSIELSPKWSWAHANLGNGLAAQGKLSEAAVSFREAIRLKPDDPLVYDHLGVVLFKQGKPDEAIAAYRKSIELNPNNAYTRTKLAWLLSEQKKFDEAIAAYRKAIEFDLKSAWAHNDLAWILATCADPKFRDPEQAVALAMKAVELGPKQWMYVHTLGVAHYRAGEWKSAIGALGRSMELRKGGDSHDWFFLAMAHWRLGDKDKAREWYDRAVQWMAKNQPTNEELLRCRAEAAGLLVIEQEKD